MRFGGRVIIGGALLLAIVALLSARAMAATPLDSGVTVAEVRRVIAENYVVADKRAAIDASLAAGLASGRYAVADPNELQNRLNADLAAAAHDPHLMIMRDPGNAAAMKGPQSDEVMEGPHWEALGRRLNHGVSELRLLDGNIRYLKLDGFAWVGTSSARALDTAMAFLRDGDAAIIDLRSNGGGSPEAVRYVISHFLPPGRLLVTFHMGAKGEANEVRTLADLPGRMVGKPLFVLTSGRTASAAEEFALHVPSFGIGEVIGETTMGAAYRNSFFPVPGGFVLSVSVGRPEHAVTHGDWEGVGVAPTVKVAAGDALDMARARAFRRLAALAQGPEATRDLWAAEAIEARLTPVAPARPLDAYAGAFGERRIGVEDGRLVYQRGGGPKSALIALGPDLFAVEMDPGARIRFAVADGAVTGFELLRADGMRESQARTAPAGH